MNYDSVNGCVSPNVFVTSAVLRWYGLSWEVFGYPVPLALGVAFNTTAVLSLRRQNRMINVRPEENVKRSAPVSAKMRAAGGLLRLSIAIAILFAITAGPYNVINAMQAIEGTVFSMCKVNCFYLF